MIKKMRFSIPFAWALILFLGLSASADFDRKWIRVSQQDSKHTEVATEMLMKKCKDCHTSHTEYPFYYNLPFIKDLIDQDIKKGLAYFNMEIEVFNKEFDSEISSTSLNKIKSVLENGSMPPLQYKLMHWDSHFSDTEKKIVTTWIKDLSNSDFIPIPSKEDLELDQNLILLGEKLFSDTRLSRDNTISCASCHDLAKGGTDQMQFSTGVAGGHGRINSPTVFNSVFNIKQFWDGRAEDLIAQASGPVHNPLEMGSNWDEVVAKLTADAEYTVLFESAFGSQEITGEKIAVAIGEFEKSLVTPDNKFDSYLKGNDYALSDKEKQGFELFKKYNCNNCHLGVSVGANSFQKMGVYKDYFADRAGGLNGLKQMPLTKEDLGRFNVTRAEADRYVFKVPTLRNIKKTFPYLHDGTIRSLSRTVEIMGEYQVGKTIPKEDVTKIVLFLKTL
jgi:cytochrome c peroxidase